MGGSGIRPGDQKCAKKRTKYILKFRGAKCAEKDHNGTQHSTANVQKLQKMCSGALPELTFGKKGHPLKTSLLLMFWPHPASPWGPFPSRLPPKAGQKPFRAGVRKRTAKQQRKNVKKYPKWHPKRRPNGTENRQKINLGAEVGFPGPVRRGELLRGKVSQGSPLPLKAAR